MRWSIVVSLLTLLFVGSPAGAAWSQGTEGTVTGTVTSTAGGPIAGALVSVAGTGRGGQSGADGRFSITGVPAGTQQLRVSHIGYGERVQTVTVTAGQSATVNVQLEPTAVKLEGVVAVGYGTQRRRDVTGAIGSVGKEELDRVQVPTIAQALQGRVAGVSVTQNSSAPGGGVSIRIRGSGSLGTTNEPLYVLDGVPISGGDNDNPTSSRSRGSSVNPLSFLNPDDIESIEVLKDASSTAIYGARGTNGVVLITTKQGRAGTSRVEWESSFAEQSVAKRLPLLNGREFAAMANEWATLDGKPIPYPDLSAVGPGIDWQSEIYRTAPMQEHQVRVLGGTDRTRFALSGSFADQQGVVLGSSFRRYSARANVSHQALSWLNVGTNLSVSRLNPTLGFTDAAQSRAAASAVNSASAFVPLMPMYNADGEYTWMDRDFLPELVALGVGGTNYENPVAIIKEGVDRAEYDRVLGNAFADVTLLPGLKLRINGGADLVNNSRSEYFTSRSRRGGQANHGLADVGSIDQSHYLAESILNYKKSIGGVHDIDLTAGTTYEHDESYSTEITNSNFPNDITMFYNLGAGTPVGGPSVGSGYRDWTLLSYLGRANYSMAGKYLLTLTGRADGSSKFGADHKWGFFPSAALAWRASEEPLIQRLGLFDDLKLRLSYGLTGNQEIGTYGSLAKMRGANYNLGGTLLSGFTPNNVANPDLRWEKSRQLDAGFDAAFLDSRVTLTFDVYRKLTEDLLLSVPLPAESGFGSALQNLGSVRNQGAEASLGLDILDPGGRGLGWRANFNVAANRNRVIEIGDRSEFFGSGISGDMKVGGLLVREGLPMGVFYGYKTDGILRDKAEADAYAKILPGAVPGQIRYVDVDGDGKITSDDRTVLGNPEPDFTVGWSNNLSLGPLTLYTFFQGARGNDVFNVNLEELTTGGIGRNMWRPAYLDRWTPENPDGKWPILHLAPGVGYKFGTSGDILDRYIEDGSYLRLRDITLSFDLPESAAHRIGVIQTARLYLSAENVFTWTKYSGFNPDVNTAGQNNINRGVDLGAYPLARVFRVGVRFGL